MPSESLRRAARSERLSQLQALHLLQRNAQNAAEGEALRETVRNAHPGADKLQEVERRPAPGQDEQELAREGFAVVGIEVQRLEVVTEVHMPNGRPAAGEFRDRN